MEYWGSTLTLKYLKPRSMVKWMPSLQGWVKINVDARLSVAKRHAVSATAVLHGLQFALDLGFTNVILERNGAAHAMVVEGLRTKEDLFWVENVPLKVLEVANSDRRFS
ncbi:hypothetical protein Goklo_029054 [Gossypium klotzschianum]|uniref:RNase H type-1 domain-containing protein n=1 Tax=Gossypium klotzschianum TaxID=34286 RepID=A0A7J8W3Y9_9ROSI|nr:hypothetical protein [Gossypium klotzschianum]